MSTITTYRVEKYFQPKPNFATSDQQPPPQITETLLETDNIEKVKEVLRATGVFANQETAWKVFIVDSNGGWEKRVEDERKIGTWVYRVFGKENDGEWKQYTG